MGGAEPAKAYRRTAGGIAIAVRLTAKAARDAVEGVETRGGRTVLKARVRAAPEKGAANAALAALVAGWLGVPRRSAAVVSGRASRLKTLAVTGEAAVLAARLEAKLEGKDEGDEGKDKE